MYSFVARIGTDTLQVYSTFFKSQNILYGDDNFTLSMLFLKIPERIRNFVQRVTSIDHGDNFPGFKQFFHKG